MRQGDDFMFCNLCVINKQEKLCSVGFWNLSIAFHLQNLKRQKHVALDFLLIVTKQSISVDYSLDEPTSRIYSK